MVVAHGTAIIMICEARIIIVTHNSESEIADCLESLGENLSGNYEVVVVDNDSTDHTVDAVKTRFSNVGVIRNNSNEGYAGGNNLGLYNPLPEFVVFLNPDTISANDWVSILISDLKSREGAGLAQARVMLHGSEGLVNSRGNEANYLFFGWPEGYGEEHDSTHKSRRISFPSGCAFAIRREALEDIEGFDSEYFMYGEDLDIGVRAFLSGWDVIYSPEAVVYHKYEYKTPPSKLFLLERNRVMTLLKTYRASTLVFAAPVLILAEVYVLLRAAKERWLSEKLRSYLSLCSKGRHVISERRRMQRFRRRSDGRLIELLRGSVSFPQLLSSAYVRMGNALLEKHRSFLLSMKL